MSGKNYTKSKALTGRYLNIEKKSAYNKFKVILFDRKFQTNYMIYIQKLLKGWVKCMPFYINKVVKNRVLELYQETFLVPWCIKIKLLGTK